MSDSAPRNALDLVIQAGVAKSREELYFTVVNRSLAVACYDRASLWSLARRPALLAVSGNVQPEPRSPFAVSWSKALARLKDKLKPGKLSDDSFKRQSPLSELAAKTEGLSALWLPMSGQGVGVLFEQWGGDEFSAATESDLTRLVAAYALLGRGSGKSGGLRRAGRLVFWLVLLAIAAVALTTVRLPLRVVAVCEVTARSPTLISAPMDGVIDEVLVAPGQQVKQGDRLALYDSRLMEEELKISRRQVAVVEAEVAGARARGFSESRYRGETAVLEARLEQEMARLEALEVRFSRRVITAPVDGTVQLDDARAWRGRPVSTGQAVLWLVDPEDTRVTLWLPQDDRIDIDRSRPIYVHLHALGGEPREARLTYVSSFAQPSADGVYAFPAEAEWLGDGHPPPLGLRGSASIYGDEASLGYWLFRRPLAWARRWLGV